MFINITAGLSGLVRDNGRRTRCLLSNHVVHFRSRRNYGERVIVLGGSNGFPFHDIAKLDLMASKFSTIFPTTFIIKSSSSFHFCKHILNQCRRKSSRILLLPNHSSHNLLSFTPKTILPFWWFYHLQDGRLCDWDRNFFRCLLWSLCNLKSYFIQLLWLYKFLFNGIQWKHRKWHFIPQYFMQPCKFVFYLTAVYRKYKTVFRNFIRT